MNSDIRIALLSLMTFCGLLRMPDVKIRILASVFIALRMFHSFVLNYLAIDYLLRTCILFIVVLVFSSKSCSLIFAIGHGIAFDKLLCIKNYKFRKSSVLVAEIQKNAKSQCCHPFPFEINLTSNFYLLGDAIRNVVKEKPLSALYRIGIPVVLSTDDDGIWPIDRCPIGHQSHHSLAAEYCRAITSRFITEEEQLQMMIAQFRKVPIPQENRNF